MSKKRTCLCCGREYKYCPTCGSDSKKPRWMIDFCSDVCNDLFNAVTAVGMGADKKELQKVITRYRINDFDGYKESIKDALKQYTDIEAERLKKVNKKKNEDVELKNNSEMSE